jgi:NTE family protein
LKTDAVFEGGGIRGLGFVGAICCFEEWGYTFESIAGTSAGAIIAALLSVGYTGSELKDIIFDTDFNKFCDKDKLQSIPFIGRLLGLIFEKGLYSGNYFENWINELLKAKGKTKFQDITVNGKCKLKIIASDISNKNIIILPDDIQKYGIDPKKFNISTAVRMSMSIPFFFKPVIVKYNKEKSYIVDGGLLSNFPIWIFDVNNKPRWPTFGDRKSTRLNSSHDDLV